MEKQITFTSTLPEKILKALDHYAAVHRRKKNKILEEAFRKYFEENKRNEFIQSFRRANEGHEMLSMAEEGITDYLKLLDP